MWISFYARARLDISFGVTTYKYEWPVKVVKMAKIIKVKVLKEIGQKWPLMAMSDLESKVVSNNLFSDPKCQKLSF